MASLLNIATTGLLAYQRALNTTGHNIANASTVGYSRQTAMMVTREPTLDKSGWMGSGVKVGSIQRHYNDFLAMQVRSSQSATAKMNTIYTQAARVDNLLADPVIGLDPAIQTFFDSLHGVADEPSSVAARQVAISDGEAMEDRFNYLNRQYDQLREDTNQQLVFATESATSLAESIANINDQIIKSVGIGSGEIPPDLLDKRDNLVDQLSELVDVTTVIQDDNSMNVFIGNGQPLVIGATASELVMMDNPANPESPDVTIKVGNSIQIITGLLNGGEIGGLLEYRSDFLDAGQNQLGLIALGMSQTLNEQHALGLDLYGNPGGPLFEEMTFDGIQNRDNQGDGAVEISFDPDSVSDLTSDDYELVYNGGTSYTLTNLTDNSQTVIDTSAPVPTIDGFNLTITNTSLQPGDSFLIRPTHFAARDIDFTLSDPNRIAAAGALHAAESTDLSGNPLNTGDAEIGAIGNSDTTGVPLAADLVLSFTNDADGLGNPGFTILNGPAPPDDYLLYDPASDDVYGKSFPDSSNPAQFAAFGGLSFEIKGTPDVGDEFVISNNVDGTADNRNALALADMQTQTMMYGGTATFQDTYAQLVSEVGSMTRYAEVNYLSQEGLLRSYQDSLSSISGVNLDEEAANLIKYQHAYQATAQVMGVASTLFDTLIGAVRR